MKDKLKQRTIWNEDYFVIADMQFNPDTLKNAWHICCNALGNFLHHIYSF